MHSLLSRLETDIAMTMSSLNCLKVEPSLRKRLAESLVPNNKIKVSSGDLFRAYMFKETEGHALHNPHCKQSCCDLDTA